MRLMRWVTLRFRPTLLKLTWATRAKYYFIIRNTPCHHSRRDSRKTSPAAWATAANVSILRPFKPSASGGDDARKKPFDRGRGGGHLLPDTIPPPSAAAAGATTFAAKRRRKATNGDRLPGVMTHYQARSTGCLEKAHRDRASSGAHRRYRPAPAPCPPCDPAFSAGAAIRVHAPCVGG
jgi:hypothetical protein